MRSYVFCGEVPVVNGWLPILLCYSAKHGFEFVYFYSMNGNIWNSYE